MMPYHECPSFNRCSASKCPLDPHIEDRDYTASDPKCVASKPTRKRIGEKYSHLLKYKGLTSREFNGLKKWAGTSMSERKIITERLAKALKSKKSRLKDGV